MAPCRQSAPASQFPANIPADMQCSICLEPVVHDQPRGVVKLQCDHYFHLSCIGSAFNFKGAMICPNCRKGEDNEWKYSGGSSPRLIPFEILQPGFGLPPDSTPPTMGHNGSSLSATADPPLELGLNIGFDGGPLYGDDQANNPEGGNGSPLELDLNIGFAGGSLCGYDQANIPADVCTMCSENIVDDISGGTTKLQCACIGSAFNVKRAMILPNCRKGEDNEWKYSLGSSIRNNDVLPTTPEAEDSSDDDNMGIHLLFQDGSPHASFIEVDQGERMLGSFPYSGATELPLFGYGGNDMPYIHYHQHTHVIPTEPGAAGNTIGEPSSPPPISVSNSMGYFRHMGAGTGFGLGGSASAGTSADGAGTSAGDAGTSAGGMPSSPRVPFESLQPDHFGFPPDSTPPTLGQRLNRSGELDSLETPAAPGHNGGSLSASADPPPELGLNIDFDGGPFYGDDQANNPEGGNGSSPGIENIDPD